MKTMGRKIFSALRSGAAALLIVSLLSVSTALAASHAEAPNISMDRFADNTDTYAFRSIEPGRSGFVTLIGNWIPLQEPSGGPQYYRFDDTVRYEFKIDNTGDGIEDVTYQFQFITQIQNPNTILGMNAVNQDGVISNLDDPDYNMFQFYTVRRIDSSTGLSGQVIASGLKTPPSNIGPRVTPNYEANLGQPAVYNLPNGGRVFAGQRDDSFYVDVGGVFDALNLRSVGTSGGIDTLKHYNVNTIAIEVPIQELTRSRGIPIGPTGTDAVIGVWATSSRRSMRIFNNNGTVGTSGEWVQVSRLGNPLVNEVVVPLRLKNLFNAIQPVFDSVIAPAVLDPELARLMQAVFGINIPPPPRNDLVQIFATGIPVNPVTGPNYTTFLSDGQPHEMLRLNVAIPPTPVGSISRLGLLGGDVAGFPNGRRPHDDVTDIALRAVAGGTPFTPATNVAPNNALGDGVPMNPEGAPLNRFPYILPPNQGNQPRPGNAPGSPAAERSWNQAPVVDENGYFNTSKK
jgi:hypothetical protein